MVLYEYEWFVRTYYSSTITRSVYHRDSDTANNVAVGKAWHPQCGSSRCGHTTARARAQIPRFGFANDTTYVVNLLVLILDVGVAEELHREDKVAPACTRYVRECASGSSRHSRRHDCTREQQQLLQQQQQQQQQPCSAHS